MMYGFRGDGGLFIGMFMFLAMLLVLVCVAALIYWLVRKGGSKPFIGSGMKGSTNPALEILKERFAKSEITQEQFLEMKKHLE